MKKHYDLLIVGATLAAAELAHENPSLSIAVIEQGCVCAPEYALALRPTNISELSGEGEFKKRLTRELTERAAVDESGAVHTPALGPITALLLLESGADCYFNSAITKLDSTENDCYRVEFFSWGISSRFTAARVIDTTTLQLTRAFFGRKAQPFEAKLNYFVSSDGAPELRTIECPNDNIAEARKLALIREADRIIMFAHEIDRTPLAADPVMPSDPKKLEFYAAKTPEPIDSGEFDVIVAGLGTAGAICATAAARMGLRVLGLENLRLQGGSGTASSVLGSYFGFKGGEYIETDRKAHKLDPKFAETYGIGAGQKAVQLDIQSSAEGVDYRFGAQVVDVIREGDKVVGAVWIQDGVPHCAKSKFVIDCTAEASVCVAAGCEMLGGRSSDGALQPYSNCILRTNGKNVGMSYTDNGVVNQYDPDEFGRTVLASSVTYGHLKSDYSNKNYLGIAPLLGLREGRKLIGEEIVTFKEMISGGFSTEPVYYGFSNLDNHGKDSILEEREYQDFVTICGLWGYGFAIPIPKGALIPKGIDGLLVAGRNIAIDHTLAMGLRMKDDCQKSGEAAAKLAALAIKHGISAREVDYEELASLLRASGCLGKTDRMYLERQKTDEIHELPMWCSDDDELSAGLASDQPGYFMWSAKESGKLELLSRLISSELAQTRWHSALAMSLLEPEQLAQQLEKLTAVLIECANSRDAYVPDSGRRHLNLRSVSAICSLGRIGGVDALPALYELLERDCELEMMEFTESDLIMDRGDLYFQYRSHIISAIMLIAKRSGDCKLIADAKAKLKAFADGKCFKTSIFATNKLHTDITDTLNRLIDGM